MKVRGFLYVIPSLTIWDTYGETSMECMDHVYKGSIGDLTSDNDKGMFHHRLS